jgi:hypothetical protein
MTQHKKVAAPHVLRVQPVAGAGASSASAATKLRAQQQCEVLYTHLQVTNSLAVMWLLLAFIIHNPHVTEKVRATLPLLQGGKQNVSSNNTRLLTQVPACFLDCSTCFGQGTGLLHDVTMCIGCTQR